MYVLYITRLACSQSVPYNRTILSQSRHAHLESRRACSSRALLADCMHLFFFFLVPPSPPLVTQVTDTDHLAQGYPPFFFSRRPGEDGQDVTLSQVWAPVGRILAPEEMQSEMGRSCCRDGIMI